MVMDAEWQECIVPTFPGRHWRKWSGPRLIDRGVREGVIQAHQHNLFRREKDRSFMREARPLGVIRGGAVYPRCTVPCVNEHGVARPDTAICQTLRRKDFLNVCFRDRVARSER